MTQTTRRRFLQYAGVTCGMTPLTLERFSWIGDYPAGLSSRLAQDPRRPQFHLLPTHNWMNDPNGPIYFAGKYHMFFQYNPEGAVWGNMSWNHAVSDDMLRWKNYPVAFTTTPDGSDAAGCFSGSTVVSDHNGKQRVYAIYTGVVKDKAHETVRNEGLRESQCLAWSDDPMLQEWTKQTTPVIANPPEGLAVTGFRDPSIWKQGDAYFMVIGSGIERVGGCVLLYRSQDLMNWEYLHPLISGAWNGAYTPNPVGDGEMWECPDFFLLDGGYVLIYSSMRKVIWQSGIFDRATLKFQPNKSGLLDIDSFYAPKTQLDAQGRRILWGWIPELRSQTEMIEAGWSGMMSLPRVLSLDSDGTLRMQLLPQTVTLRRESIKQRNTKARYVITVPKATGEVLCIGKKEKAVEFTVNLGESELLRLTYLPEQHAWLADGKNIILQPSDIPKVHAFMDGSVIEVVLSERVGYTKRFYYPGTIAPDITVQATVGTALAAWTISPISDNRLTTTNSLA